MISLPPLSSFATPPLSSNTMPQLAAAVAIDDPIARLGDEALRHRAVRHPYLLSLAAGTLPDMRWALADFARHYHAYSRAFPRYLTAVIARLDSAAHRGALLGNLTEESGVYGDDEIAELAAAGIRRKWIDGVPHPELFRRFGRALGVDHGDGTSLIADEATQVVAWRELLLATLSHGSAAEAIGALGLGTEHIVRTIYAPFVAALARTDLDLRDTVFFALHTTVDDHHQATLAAIARDFAQTPEGLAGLRRGMVKALSLRCGFWDWMLARACDPTHADEVI